MEFAPDGRLFVTEKDTGKIRVIEWNEADGTGTLLEEPFATIPASTLDTRQTRGLLGLTFHPDFGDGTHDYVYVHYTHRQDGSSYNRIIRFKADASNPNVAAEDEIGNTLPPDLIFEMNKLGTAETHDGGHIEFGNDEKLYIPVGDNKRNKEPPLLNTMKLTNLFGKVLRINADGSIPTDNPFYNETTDNNRAIYARGFRNPFTMAVEPDPAVEPASKGRIYINDVGEQTWEEVNRLLPRGNYGWPKYEGPRGDRRFKKPVFAYRHTGSCRCAISGGAFYYAPEGASAAFPAEYEGDYFFTDLSYGWIRKLEGDGKIASNFATGANSAVDLKVGPDGGLYYLELGGTVRVIRPTPAPAG